MNTFDPLGPTPPAMGPRSRSTPTATLYVVERDCRQHYGRSISFDPVERGEVSSRVALRCSVHSAGAQPFAGSYRTAIKAPACAALTWSVVCATVPRRRHACSPWRT